MTAYIAAFAADNRPNSSYTTPTLDNLQDFLKKPYVTNECNWVSSKQIRDIITQDENGRWSWSAERV